MLQFSISADGSNGRQQKYRRYERFSMATLIVGLAIVYMITFFLTRKASFGIFVCVVIAFLYLIGSTRRQA